MRTGACHRAGRAVRRAEGVEHRPVATKKCTCFSSSRRVRRTPATPHRCCSAGDLVGCSCALARGPRGNVAARRSSPTRLSRRGHCSAGTEHDSSPGRCHQPRAEPGHRVSAGPESGARVPHRREALELRRHRRPDLVVRGAWLSGAQELRAPPAGAEERRLHRASGGRGHSHRVHRDLLCRQPVSSSSPSRRSRVLAGPVRATPVASTRRTRVRHPVRTALSRPRLP